MRVCEGGKQPSMHTRNAIEQCLELLTHRAGLADNVHADYKLVCVVTKAEPGMLQVRLGLSCLCSANFTQIGPWIQVAYGACKTGQSMVRPCGSQSNNKHKAMPLQDVDAKGGVSDKASGKHKSLRNMIAIPERTALHTCSTGCLALVSELLQHTSRSKPLSLCRKESMQQFENHSHPNPQCSRHC